MTYLVLATRSTNKIKLGHSIWEGWEHQLGWTDGEGIELFKGNLSMMYDAEWKSDNGGLLQSMVCHEHLTIGILEIRLLYPVKGIHSYHDSQVAMLKGLFTVEDKGVK